MFYCAEQQVQHGLDHIRSEIDHMRRQIIRQRKEILTLARAGISTTAAEALLARMQDKTDTLAAEPRPPDR